MTAAESDIVMKNFESGENLPHSAFFVIPYLFLDSGPDVCAPVVGLVLLAPIAIAALAPGTEIKMGLNFNYQNVKYRPIYAWHLCVKRFIF